MMQQSYRLLRSVVASLCLLATALLMSLGASAQDRQVSGTVTDAADGSAIPGVNVSVKGTTRGVTTGADGAYRISAADGATLVFSYVGYTTQEVPLGSQTALDVKLAADVTSLEEVVVVGYGTAKKKDLTGSVSQVSAKDFNPGINNNPLQAIQGRVAGLVISNTSGDPTSNPQVRLRGITSLTGNADPLTVVDGVIGVPLNSVSPNDIETIDVLKDASAAAIYGSRAANGVIVVTTKRGKEGRSSVSYSNYFAYGSTARKLPFLTGDEYRTQVRRIKGDAALAGIDKGGNTDWLYGELIRPTFSQNHDLGFTGGGNGFSYRASINYLSQPGLIKNTGLNRLQGRINVDQKALNNRLNIQYNLAFTNDDKKLLDDNITGRAALFLPVFPVRNADGTYYEQPGSFDLFNPVAMREGQTWDRRDRTVIAATNIGYEIIDGLTLRANLAYRLNNGIEGRKYQTGIRAYLNANGEAQRRTDETNNVLAEGFANYVRSFDNINMNLLAGYSFQQETNEGFNARNQGFVTDELGYNQLGQGTATTQLPGSDYVGSYRNRTRLISFFGRATFDLFERFNVTATLRRDGSSKFGANNKWGLFPSFAAGWTISDEAFLKGVTAINFLKLRAGWGQTGNSEGLQPYGSIERYRRGSNYFDGATGQWQPGYFIGQNENPNLKWEVVQQTNIGLDFAFLNNKLRGSLDFFDKQTKDMLFVYNVPVPPNKFDRLQSNVGQMQNRGVELSLNYAAIQQSDFTWNVGVVASKINTQVKSLSGSGVSFTNGSIRFSPFGGRGLSDVFASQLIEGRPLGEFLIPRFAGFATDGSMLLVKKGGGTTSTYDQAELFQSGNPQPTFTASLTNAFTYKNFDLSFLLRGVFGNKILNNIRSNFSIPGSILESNAFRGVADQPINYSVNQLSDYWLESGSFVRMDNLQLGYNFPVNSKILNRARVYLAGQNLFLITKYTGTDPELDTRGTLENNDDQTPSSIGIDNRGIYPKQRTFILGFQFTF
jgi:iron complex outermembrane receptor protein